MAGRHKLPKFSIEDAFEEDADDAIRLYGSTNDRSVFVKTRQQTNKQTNDNINSNVEDPMIGPDSKSFLSVSVPDVDVSIYLC